MTRPTMLTGRGILGAAVALLCIVGSSRASAQVNVEPLRQRLGDAGLGAQLAASSTVRGGNTEGLEVGASFLLGARQGRHLGYASSSADYSRQDGETLISKAFAHLRYNYALDDGVTVEAFAQAERDQFRRLRVRELAGAGPRFRIIENDVFSAHWAQAYMLEYTRRSSEGQFGRERQTVHRLSTYVALSLALQERVELQSVTYYQPRWDRWGDFRWLTVTGLQFQVTDRLASRIDATFSYESRVPDDLRRDDYEVENSLQLQF